MKRRVKASRSQIHEFISVFGGGKRPRFRRQLNCRWSPLEARQLTPFPDFPFLSLRLSFLSLFPKHDRMVSRYSFEKLKRLRTAHGRRSTAWDKATCVSRSLCPPSSFRFSDFRLFKAVWITATGNRIKYKQNPNGPCNDTRRFMQLFQCSQISFMRVTRNILKFHYDCYERSWLKRYDITIINVMKVTL